jgi:hypothetical protein
MPPSPTLDRRAFVVSASRWTAGLGLLPAPLLAAHRPPSIHPEPRPDVDGSRVLSREDVTPGLADLFDEIRQIPHVVDGIGCHCGCSFLDGMRSLLSCYEGVGMAQGCHICEGEGRLAVELCREGRTLDQIREAIDRRFG